MTEARTTNGSVVRAIEALIERAVAAGLGDLRDDLGRIRAAAASLAEQLETLAERTANAQGPATLREIRHDLRTPVNQIKGYCELLQEEVADGGHGEGWDRALAELHTLTEQLEQDVETVAARVAGSVGRSRRRPVGTNATPPAPVGRPGRETEDRARATVLVVDDRAGNRDLLTRVLQRDGYEVRTAADGREGLEVARREPIDLVLLDILMPHMDGYETLERLKADDELRHVPVIMLTSLDEHSSIARCIEAGAEDHLPKPFDPVLLRARLGSSLERKRSRDRERSYLAQIVAAKRRADDLLHGVIPLGVALSSEQDEARLLQRILAEARRFCGADGGVLHLFDGRELTPMHVQVASLSIDQDIDSAGAEKLGLPSTAVGASEGAMTPAVRAALEGRTIRLALEGPPEASAAFDLAAVAAFDRAHDYRTHSVLCLPLRAAGSVVGVLQLWNATRPTDGEVIAFEDGPVEVLESLSLLAAAALDAYRREHALRQQIRSLEIRIDQANRRREVSEITETDYFKRLREQARRLRKGASGG